MTTNEGTLAKITKFVMHRTPRERALGAGAIAIAAGIALYSLVLDPTREAFARQADQLKDLNNTYSVAPDVLARYGKLVARRSEIANFYEKVDLKADPLSHLEQLIKDVAQVPAGAYSVSPREGVPLGGKYAHKIYVVKFETLSLENLANFLKQLTTGGQPMLLSQISLEKRTSADSLQVQLEVSGFEMAAK